MKKIVVLLALASIAAPVFATAFSDAVNLMNPKSWRTFVAGGSANFVTGSANPIFIYSNNGVWDPVTRQLLYVGSPHAQPWNMIIWRDSTNQWRNGPLHSEINSIHSYDNITIDPAAGMMYYWPNHAPLLKFNPRTDAWSTVSTSNAPGSGYGQGIEYFPEANAIFYVNGTSLSKLSMQTLAWTDAGSLPGAGGYHNLIIYNPVHKIIAVGGGNGSQQMYKLTATGTITAFNPAPMEVGINTGLLTVCPVTGVFLYLTDTGLWEWNITTDAWTRLGNNPWNPTSIAGDYHMAAVWFPISTYGVNALVSTYQYTFLIYKYANKTAVEKTPAPGPVSGLMASPNPAMRSTRFSLAGSDPIVSLRIYGPDGSLAAEVPVKAGEGFAEWKAEGARSGLYLARAKTVSGRSLTKRVAVFK